MEMAVSAARAKLADVVDRARVGREPVYLTRRGRRVAAVIDSDQLDRLLAAGPAGTAAARREPPVNAERERALTAMVRQNGALVDQSIPPLLDVHAFYEAREPRL
jgi:prevent-host-death family protein